VRAHLENWAIKVDQLKSDDPPQGSTAASERRRTAKYHGIDVEVETCKIYDSDSCESLRLRNEITALAQSRHPNIIGFLGAGFCGDCCLVVTESLGFASLESIMSSPSWRASKGSILNWSLDLARAVSYLHSSDPVIIHQDICPRTLLVSNAGVLKLSGFGKCKFVSSSDRNGAGYDRRSPKTPRREIFSPTLSCNLLLSPDDSQHRFDPESPFVAPELVQDPCSMDEKSDIYSMAMVMRCLQTGGAPLADLCSAQGGCISPADDAKRARPCRADPSCLRWPAFSEVVKRAAAEDPAERPTSEALIVSLEAIQGRRVRHRRGLAQGDCAVC
jgi:serine/threonine protein kinase